MAKVNPFRFSTKYQDDETDLLYYGYRYYRADIGRWLSRDPVNEGGGANLYGLVANNPVMKVDPLGLDKLELVFDFSTPSGADLYNEPESAILIDKAEQLLQIAKQNIGKYDPKGKCDNCIKHLVIAAHGGGPGVLPMGDVDYSGPLYEDYLRKKGLLSPEQFEKYLKKRSYLAAVASARAILQQLAALKCEDEFRITVLACNAGEGEAGKSLRGQLLEIFGPKATVVTYEGQCGFAPWWKGGGTCSKGWDILCWEKKKIGN
jgi:RHS repeat-associated protein